MTTLSILHALCVHLQSLSFKIMQYSRCISVSVGKGLGKANWKMFLGVCANSKQHSILKGESSQRGAHSRRGGE